MFNAQKNQLSKKIRALSPKSLRGILSIVKGSQPQKNGVVQIDINKLPNPVLHKLDQYVKDQEMAKNQAVQYQQVS